MKKNIAERSVDGSFAVVAVCTREVFA